MDRPKDKRRVIRIKDKSYQLILDIQKSYEKNIGIKPTLTQLIDLGLNKLAIAIKKE